LFEHVAELRERNIFIQNFRIDLKYVSPNIIRMIKSRRMRWVGHVTLMGEMNAYRILEGNTERKRPLGRPKRRWSDNVKIDVRGIGWGGMHWIELAQDSDQWKAVVSTVMNLLVP
jgi:hypothetical protein